MHDPARILKATGAWGDWLLALIIATRNGVYMLKESFAIRRVIAPVLVASGLVFLNTS